MQWYLATMKKKMFLILQGIYENEEYFRSRDVELEIWYIDDGSGDHTREEVKS